MLARGLESLIPKKNTNQNNRQGSNNSQDFTNNQNQQNNNEPFWQAKEPVAFENKPSFSRPKESALGSDLGNFQQDSDFQLEEKQFPSQPLLKSKDSVYLIEISKIKPNPYQPRRYFNQEELQELADSIREYGLLQPLIVTKVISQTEYGQETTYQLVAGERRFLASKMIGLERVPAIIKEVAEEKEKLEMAIIENLQRQNLNPIESARAFARLSDEFKLSQREIAIKLGKSREAIANTLRLLQLSKEAQEALENGKITESHARIILSFSNYEHQNRLLGEIIKYELSVRETQERARNIARSIVSTDYLEEKIKKRKQKPKKEIDPVILETERFLEDFFSTPIEITQRGKEGGKISIRFFDKDHLKEIIEKMTKKQDDLLD